ncbi:MAG: 30S ribosomal protein S17 [Phycisphaerales bacterium]|nr:30S ribosomal protein S17 [Phycisphaerales bacterium]
MTTSTAKPPSKTSSDAASHKGTRVGVVETDVRNKTRKVVVAYMAMHPKYGKFIRQRTVLHVHDEANESRTGDIVEVAHCRPISKTKTWKLVRIVEKRSELAAALASAKSIGEAPAAPAAAEDAKPEVKPAATPAAKPAEKVASKKK